MKLIKCEISSCMQPEMWDSEYEVAQHNEKYHPEVFEVTNDLSWGHMYRHGSFEQVFADIFFEAFTLLIERQRKYGPENIRQLGLWGVFGRFADDKVNRIRRAFSGTIDKGVLHVELTDGDFDDESLEDALLDTVNYPGIMLAMKRGLWGKPLEEDMDE